MKLSWSSVETLSELYLKEVLLNLSWSSLEGLRSSIGLEALSWNSHGTLWELFWSSIEALLKVFHWKLVWTLYEPFETLKNPLEELKSIMRTDRRTDGLLYCGSLLSISDFWTVYCIIWICILWYSQVAFGIVAKSRVMCTHTENTRSYNRRY